MTNLLFIAGTGLLMSIAMIALYFLGGKWAAENIRFLLPIPPLAVASYVFVFNLYRHHQENFSFNKAGWSDLMWGTIVATAFFFLFSLLMISLVPKVVAWTSSGNKPSQNTWREQQL